MFFLQGIMTMLKLWTLLLANALLLCQMYISEAAPSRSELERFRSNKVDICLLENSIPKNVYLLIFSQISLYFVFFTKESDPLILRFFSELAKSLLQMESHYWTMKLKHCSEQLKTT